MFTEDISPGSSITEKNRRAVWLQERRSGLGASDVAAIFGLSPYKSPLALYFEKRGEIDIPESEREALYWGRILEAPIARRYGDETKRRVELGEPYQIARHATMPFMIATIDAVAMYDDPQGPPPPAGGPGNVEIKNVGFFKREEWTDEPPLPFLIQANHQMFVKGFEWASLAALVGGSSFFWADIARNNAFIEVLVARCKEFWQRIQDGNPPEPDYTESTKQLLKQLYPKDTGEIVALPKEYCDIDETLVRIKAEQKKLQEQRDTLEAKLKLAIGSATAATLDNGAVYTLKTTDRREFVTKASSFRTLRRKGE